MSGAMGGVLGGNVGCSPARNHRGNRAEALIAFSVDEVASLLARTTFPPAGTTVHCAVSGGPDSLALLVLAAAAGCEATAFYVDHGLREGGAAEAELVARAAQRCGAGFERLEVAVAAGPNLEARARAARFAVLPADVATGHTMDDQAETVLCNLLRGAAVDGMAGMRQGPRHPILGLRRRETRAVCDSAGLVWLEDPTNRDPRHLRNRVRHEVLPHLGELAGRDLVPVLARQASLMAEESGELDAIVAALVPDPADARRLAEVPRAVARRALRGWLRAMAVTPRDGGRGSTSRHPPTLAEVDRVVDVARGAAGSTQVSGGWTVRRSGGRLRVIPPGAGVGSS